MSNRTRMDNPAVGPLVADSTEDESDELFSDDEQKKEIRHKFNVSQDPSILRPETPLSSLDDSSNTIMPTDAVIPSTPLSLLPFLNKINEQWSSDLETPQAQARTKPMTSSTTEEIPKLEQRTPDLSAVKSVEKIISESPVIASRATRRRSKRCIFRSPISTDPLAVTNNENITVNVETPVISDANSVATNASISNSSLESTLKDREPKVPNSLDTCNNEENVTNAVPDSLNTSTQEFFYNASFSKIDELCSNTFDNEKTMETTAMQYNDEQNIEDIDKGKNVEENKNIGFFTARGTSINVSKQALFKAKRLFADAFDTDEAQNYESFAKRNSNEEKNRHLPSSSFANNVSVNIAKEVLSKPKPLTEQFKNYDKMHTTDFKKPLVNKSPSEEVSNVPILISTASGNPINISKEALLKAKTLLADESDNADDNVLIKYDRSPTDKNPMTVNKSPSEEVSNVPILFSTASGNPINISKEALLKAKMLLGDESENADDNALIKYSERSPADKHSMTVNKSPSEEVSNVPVLFSTASGNPINISKEALLKAKMLLDESENAGDNVLIKYSERSSASKNMTVKNVIRPSFVINKPINISKKSLPTVRTLFAEQSNSTEFTSKNKIDIADNEQRDINTSNIGFSTTRDTPVNSKQANFKARTLFAEQLDDSLEDIHNNDNEIKRQETKVSKVGFQTAGGKAINISEQALSRANALFAEHLDDTLKAAVTEETNIHDNKVKGLEVKIANIRFQSTGSIVDISEERPKAKISFEQLDDQSEPVIAKATKIDDKIENRQEVKIPSIGFQTACGTSINISEHALSRAKALFADQLDCLIEMDIPENTGRDDGRKIKKRDLTIPHGGLQTASGQQVPVLNNAALIARELFSNDCLDESNSDLGRASLQKRKLSETNADESTPQGRNRAFETKKARLSSEFQARKLFSDNPSVDTDNNENRDSDVKKQAPSVANSALGSPKRDAIESIEADAAGSPVLGRQPISRKRKSLGYQRDEHSALRTDRKILSNENTPLQENIVQGGAACGKIEDDKLNTQKPTQVAKERAKGGSTESNDYGDTQVMMDFIDESTKILQDRLAAALEQETIITAKRRHGSKQSVGHLYRYKQTNSNARLSLREIGGGTPPVPRSYQELIDRRIPPSILEIAAATAATYRFRCSDFYGTDVACNNVRGIEMEDGACLILDENGYAGVWEFLRAFLAGPGVDPNLVPARWVENHYRWIVWKLASMDRMKFGSAELPRVLTPSHIMAQLKYRYDREIDRSQRPALRRILEKDDVASKRMILCVSSIVENNNVSMEIGKSPRIGVPKWKIELTDGWYNVNACIDVGMVRNISIGKIREGTKLVISGAELLNCDQGFYPLEVPADVCLKLHTNSTRRARWDMKLGYAPRSGPIPIKLRNVCPSGGLIGEMTIVVARVYPMLYHEKTTSGDSIVRNAKSEEKAQSKYEQQCWAKIEAFNAKAEDFQRKGLSCETDDMAIERIQLNEDYENLSTEESVSKKRHDELLQELRQKEERFKQRMQSKLRESLPGPRQVSQLLKVRVCDENANAILSIWSPSEEVVDALKEGACVSLCNIVASGKRGTELQLTARRSAIFKPGKMRDASYPARVCMPLCEIANSEFAPPYGEFDTVGLVCSVGPAPYGMKDFEAVHLAYCKADSSDSSYLSILFWQGIASYGYGEILTVGSIVACSNLEWRRATSWNVPAAYCTERSTFTCNPRRNHLHESFENLRNLIMDPIKYVERCTFELNVELQKKSTPTRYTPGKNTPIKIYSSTLSADKKLVDYTSPLATPKLRTGDSSNFIASNPSIQKRLEKLQHYGEAPELSPIILKRSKRVSLDFRSPISIPNVNSTKKTSKANQPEDLNLSSTTEKH
ncbi:uncharacterized protein [Temnothorax nylanderi]|uniref:uncharacterized protein isoform X2 n=1 Tax=Temnothorax nylanderi TaxID=102681 RepID=UPI003A83A48A